MGDPVALGLVLNTVCCGGGGVGAVLLYVGRFVADISWGKWGRMKVRIVRLSSIC